MASGHQRNRVAFTVRHRVQGLLFEWSVVFLALSLGSDDERRIACWLKQVIIDGRLNLNRNRTSRKTVAHLRASIRTERRSDF